MSKNVLRLVSKKRTRWLGVDCTGIFLFYTYLNKSSQTVNKNTYIHINNVWTHDTAVIRMFFVLSYPPPTYLHVSLRYVPIPIKYHIQLLFLCNYGLYSHHYLHTNPFTRKIPRSGKCYMHIFMWLNINDDLESMTSRRGTILWSNDVAPLTLLLLFSIYLTNFVYFAKTKEYVYLLTD